MSTYNSDKYYRSLVDDADFKLQKGSYFHCLNYLNDSLKLIQDKNVKSNLKIRLNHFKDWKWVKREIQNNKSIQLVNVLSDDDFLRDMEVFYFENNKISILSYVNKQEWQTLINDFKKA